MVPAPSHLGSPDDSFPPSEVGLARLVAVWLWLRERVYGLALGYSAQDDADRLAHDLASKHWTNDSSASPSNHG